MNTSQEPSVTSSNSRYDLILTSLKAHPIRSVIIVGLFIVYLPIVYQIHLNLVAATVWTTAGGYFWTSGGLSLFPIPYDATWFGSAVTFPILRLTPMEAYVYSHIYPSIIPRVMWSVMWLTFGIIYIVSPLLKSKDKE
ncbi:MAG: hypothetical protein ACTSSD_19140 [Candidatus Thorarchaeota archaeon]